MCAGSAASTGEGERLASKASSCARCLRRSIWDSTIPRGCRTPARWAASELRFGFTLIGRRRADKHDDLPDRPGGAKPRTQELEYNTNYTKKELEKIAEYYEISKRKKKKQDLVEDIVLFEKAPENVEMVYRRKRLWSYIEEIKADKYLSKYLIFE